MTDFRNPTGIFVFLDEHPDSINDDWMVFCSAANPAERSAWSDLPASYHNGAGGFSFADGHSEIKKWASASTKRGVKQTSSDFPVSVGNDASDIASNGAAGFGGGQVAETRLGFHMDSAN